MVFMPRRGDHDFLGDAAALARSADEGVALGTCPSGQSNFSCQVFLDATFAGGVAPPADADSAAAAADARGRDTVVPLPFAAAGARPAVLPLRFLAGGGSSDSELLAWLSSEPLSTLLCGAAELLCCLYRVLDKGASSPESLSSAATAAAAAALLAFVAAFPAAAVAVRAFRLLVAAAVLAIAGLPCSDESDAAVSASVSPAASASAAPERCGKVASSSE